MAIIETLIGPIAALIDKLIPDPKARDAVVDDALHRVGYRRQVRPT